MRAPGTWMTVMLCLLALPAWAQQATTGMVQPNAIGDHPLQVTLVKPTSGQQFVAGSPIILAADAFDPDDNVAQVTMIVDGVSIGTNAGFSYYGTRVMTAGSHTVQAMATNDHIPMKMAYSATATITVVPNTLPTVSLTSPANGASYTVGATVPMTATASDSDGSIVRVEFLVDGAMKGQDTASPYTYNWTAQGGNHTMQARAVDDANGTTTTSAITIHGKPSVSTLTVPTSSHTGAYSVSWTSASGATHYQLSEKIGSGSWTVIQDTSATSKSISGKVDGSYSYRVRGCAGSGTTNCSAYSATKTIAVAITPAVPTLTVPTSSNSGSYSVSWTSASGATHYQLSEKIGSGSWAVIQDTSATSKSLSGKTDGSYSYRVRACKASGTGNCSAYSSTKVIAVAVTPAVPTLTVPASNTSAYIVSWTNASGATHYQLSEKVGSGSWAVIQDTSATSKSLSGKTNGSYSYRVRACKASGTGNCSAYSSTKTITVVITTPITRTYTYNAYQELCGVQEPETGTTLMGYDAAGNLAWSASGLDIPAGPTDPPLDCAAESGTAATLARKATRTYDARNRVTALAFADGLADVTYTYTPTGQMAGVVAPNDGGSHVVTTTYTYNARGLLEYERQYMAGATWSHDWIIDYVYDANAHLARQKVIAYGPAHTVDYAPNALGQPTQAGTYATNVTYFPNGAMQSFTYGNGIVHTLTQNARGLPDRSRDAYGSTAIHDDSYDYDHVGNVLAISDGVSGHQGDRDMVYDDLNRLVWVEAPGMFGTATYTYDAVDNLRSVQVTGGNQPRNHTYIYDASNRLTNITVGGSPVATLTYDAQGNLANKDGVLYTFDQGNRLRSVSSPASEYLYDGLGRRVWDGAGGSRYSVYSQPGQLVFDYDKRSQRYRWYVYLNGSLVAIHDEDYPTGATSTTYQHTDALGSPVAITNSSKTVIERREYEPYGYQTTPTLQDGPNYTGHVADAATGMIYMQQRYCDPMIGRCLSVDPVTAYDEGDMRYFNRYAYAFNNPYAFKDPDGRCPSCVGALVGAGLDFAIQVAEIGLGSRTEIDGTSILVSAGTGALGVGLAGKLGRIGGLVADVAVSVGSTAAKGDEVTVGGVVADVAFGRAGGAAAEKAIVKTAEHKVAQRQANRLERIGNKPGARDAQKARAQNAGPALQRSTEQRAAQAGVVSAGVGSAAEKQLERKLDQENAQ